jgi:hypothetical protein
MESNFLGGPSKFSFDQVNYSMILGEGSFAVLFFVAKFIQLFIFLNFFFGTGV